MFAYSSGDYVWYPFHKRLNLMGHELTRICWPTDDNVEFILEKLMDIFGGPGYWGWEVGHDLYKTYPGPNDPPISGDEEEIINEWLKSEGAVLKENVLIDMNQ